MRTHTAARRATFRHGVHPEGRKEATQRGAIERMPFVEEYVLPLSQHLGAPSVPIVKKGDPVKRGQMLAKPGGFVSVALHSPVSGTIKAIELRPHPNGKFMQAIVVEADAFSSQRGVYTRPPPLESLALDDAIALIQNSGLVGLGGAAFPTHVKLKVPKDKHVHHIILNGCECEPYLTCDHRIMTERPDAVIRGLRMFMQIVGVDEGYIGVESNKADAIEALRSAAEAHPQIHVMALQVKYPQGAEKMLIEAIFHKEVPSGKLPIDIGMIVQNVGSAVALADFFESGMPTIERVVTVTGEAIRRPGNFMVPIGTPLRALIDHCGGLDPRATDYIILGGPMMGMAQKSLDVPLLKGTSGLLALSSDAVPYRDEQPCIRCGRCLDACAMFLNPSRLAALTRVKRVDQLESYHLMDCFECAACSYVCPSRIPLVQLMRMGKALVREKKMK